jgi:hypothetical protein
MPRGPQRTPFRFPRKNFGFRGLHSREGLTDEIYQAGYLYRFRNYHLIGRGRALKRQGYQSLVPVRVSGANAPSSLTEYSWGSTRYLIAMAAGKLYKMNAGGTGWDDVSGPVSAESGEDAVVTWSHIRDGAGNWLIGNLGKTGSLIRWGGTGTASVIVDTSGQGPAPTRAVAVAEWSGRGWFLGTDNGETILQYTGDQNSSSFAPNDYIICSEESPGVGLSRHGRNGLLVFHQRSIHAILFESSLANPFVVRTLDENLGAASGKSIVFSGGATYFAATGGIYRVTSLSKPPEYLGLALEDSWAKLNKSRIENIVAFVRGEPWNEVVFLATQLGYTTNNIAFVYNTELDTWSVFDSWNQNFMKLVAGCNWRNSSGQDLTVVADSAGYVHKAWGDSNNSTGYLDGGASGAAIETELQTGLLDMGWEGQKRIRQAWVDTQVSANTALTMDIIGIGGEAAVSKTVTISASGARLDIDDIYDAATLGSIDDPSQGLFRISTRSRAFQVKLTERNQLAPHTVNSMFFWFHPRGSRFES